MEIFAKKAEGEWFSPPTMRNKVNFMSKMIDQTVYTVSIGLLTDIKLLK